jgi:predicted nucleic acid-binding protein
MNKHFIDTNVLIYAYSNDEPEKSQKANEAIFADNTLISLQVINEFSNTCLRKLKITPQNIIASIEELTSIIIVTGFSQSTQIRALQLINKYRFSYYDSLIIATAIENSCSVLYSEDMQHNQKIEIQLRIINPFL